MSSVDFNLMTAFLVAVVRRLISANPGEKSESVFLLFKRIFSILRAPKGRPINNYRKTEFAFEAFTSEFQISPNPGLS